MPAVATFAPRGQSRSRRPQRVQLFRNDNWPPRPPAQALPVPSFLGSPDSDTLLRALPTPSFVTPQEPKAPVPTKAVIQASAVPLADWFADVVWALYLGPTQSGGGNSGLAGADKAPQPLTAFVHAVLSQTLASPQCAALGLYYLVRLPVRMGAAGVRVAGPLWNVAVDAEGHTCYASVHDRERAARAGFVAELYGGGEDVPYRLAALALMLGNKWLDDHTFTNKTWHEVTHLDLARLTALEQRALECFNYSLGVANDDWRAWLGVLKEGAVNASAAITAAASVINPSVLGAVGTSVEANATSVLAIEVMERLEKEHEVLTAGVGAGVVDVFAVADKGVIGDRRQSAQPAPTQAQVAQTQAQVQQAQAQAQVQQSSVPFPSSEMDLDELEMEQVEIDIDLDDGGPVPDELRRPVKVRLGGKGVWGEDTWSMDVGEEVNTKWGKGGEKWGKEMKEMKGDKWSKEVKEEDVWDDEWERAVRAAGGDRFAEARESWLMGIVEDGEDRYAQDRLAREAKDVHPIDNGRDYWIQPGAEWRAVQRPGKKEHADKPRVELYDARLRYDVHPYGYPGKYGYPRSQAYEYPSKQYEFPSEGYEYHNPKGEYYDPKGYYPSYEAVPREPGCVYDLGPEATAGFDYGCPYSYVPRQVPVPTWVPQKSSGCVLS